MSPLIQHNSLLPLQKNFPTENEKLLGLYWRLNGRIALSIISLGFLSLWTFNKHDPQEACAASRRHANEILNTSQGHL